MIDLSELFKNEMFQEEYCRVYDDRIVLGYNIGPGGTGYTLPPFEVDIKDSRVIVSLNPDPMFRNRTEGVGSHIVHLPHNSDDMTLEVEYKMSK